MEKSKFTMSDSEGYEPVDKNMLAYAICLYLGLSNLFPWNCVITASSYWSSRFCQTPYATSFESYFSFCATAFQTVGLALSVVYQERFSLHDRTVYPLVLYSLIFALTSLFVLVPSISGTLLFWITIICVTLVGLCGALLSGGLFSMGAVFPPQYTAALMSGQALAGMVVSISDLLTSAAGKQPEEFCSNADGSGAESTGCNYTVNYSAFTYFLLATLILLAAAGFVYILMRLPFAVFYMRKAEWEWRSSDLSNRILSTTNTNTTRTSKSQNSVNEPLLMEEAESSAVSFHASKLRRDPSLERMDSELQASVELGGVSFSTITRVLKSITVPAFAACFTFTVTLSLFPAMAVLFTSEHKCQEGGSSRFYNDLFVPFLFLVFNSGDFCGRVTAGWRQVFNGSNIWIPAVLRVVFVPLFLLCNVNQSKLPVVFSHDVFPILFMFLFSFSSGYVASSAMMLGPTLALQADKNLAGTIMIFCLTLGLTLGSVLSFAIVDISQGKV